MKCQKAMEIMNKRNVDQLPVVGEDGAILGSLQSFLYFYKLFPKFNLNYPFQMSDPNFFSLLPNMVISRDSVISRDTCYITCPFYRCNNIT